MNSGNDFKMFFEKQKLKTAISEVYTLGGSSTSGDGLRRQAAKYSKKRGIHGKKKLKFLKNCLPYSQNFDVAG